MTLDLVFSTPRPRPDETLIPLNKPYNPNFGQGGFKTPGAPARTPNPFAQSTGGRTPGWGGGRTPNPYANGDGRTPGLNASSRTPNPYGADGGKTPAWNASARTPNPYQDGGKTPAAWSASSRTPNPYQDGGKTPAAWNAGSRTPNPYGNNESPRWANDGGRTPRSGSGSGSGWGGGGWGGSSEDNAWGGNTSPARPADTGYSSYVSTIKPQTSTSAYSLDKSLHRPQLLRQHRLQLRPQLRHIQMRRRLVPWGRQALCTQPRRRGSQLRTRTIQVSDLPDQQKTLSHAGRFQPLHGYWIQPSKARRS